MLYNHYLPPLLTQPLSVQHCCCVLVDYHPYPSDDPPHIKYTTPLKQGDFVHFKTVSYITRSLLIGPLYTHICMHTCTHSHTYTHQPTLSHAPTHSPPLPHAHTHTQKYNSDWWIGRVVGHETGMTFVPR